MARELEKCHIERQCGRDVHKGHKIITRGEIIHYKNRSKQLLTDGTKPLRRELQHMLYYGTKTECGGWVKTV